MYVFYHDVRMLSDVFRQKSISQRCLVLSVLTPSSSRVTSCFAKWSQVSVLKRVTNRERILRSADDMPPIIGLTEVMFMNPTSPSWFSHICQMHSFQSARRSSTKKNRSEHQTG